MFGAIQSAPKSDDGSIGLRAAQYVRMSTIHQKYSTENQAVAIAAFAAQRNLEIVAHLRRPRPHGVRIDGRADLQRLIRT